ncbi:MAG TPA: class I SAM-dependent methyltransferase [Bradyrhizobium sp.]|nr:class I SAM-dependent methyltransferase [Bradyrhizobium sp.]
MTRSLSSTESRQLFYSVYDTLFAKKDYSAEVQSVLGLGGIRAPARILELGCGTGNHTRCFAGAGHSVTGVDPDQEMLTIARAKLALLPGDIAGHISYHHGEVHDLPVAAYDLATALFNVINYIATRAALDALMRDVARRLKPGASFIFDVWNGNAALIDPPGGKTVSVEAGGSRVKVELAARTDVVAKTTELTYFIEASDLRGNRLEQGKYTIWHFLWPPEIIVEAARAAGLESRAVHPLFDISRTATEHDWKLMFHFRKPAPDAL